MSHIFHVFAVVFVSTLSSILLSIGTSFSGSYLVAAAVMAVTTVATVVPGVYLLVHVRQMLKLMQVGRLLQMFTFFLITSLAFLVIGLFPASGLLVGNAWLTGLSVLSGTVLFGAVTGAFRSSIRRTWFPVTIKSKL
ncbi:MAG: hypothetical protein K8F91_27345 [Candidatus Obscuribacterales bacterium]|nr:hypothetical protein [Candidatus Obscuribacterales bacterium]